MRTEKWPGQRPGHLFRARLSALEKAGEGALLFALLGAEDDEDAGQDRGGPLEDLLLALSLGELFRLRRSGLRGAFGTFRGVLSHLRSDQP